MAQPQVGHSTTTVTTTPVMLFEAPTTYGKVSLYIANEGGSKAYLGDETVTITGALEGYNLNNGATLSMELNGGEQIWCVSASSAKICLLWTL
jgi:hypothetical protein